MAGLPATRAKAMVCVRPPLSARPAGTRISARVMPPGTPMTLVVLVIPATEWMSGPIGAVLPATMAFTNVSVWPLTTPPKMPPPEVWAVLPLIVEFATVVRNCGCRHQCRSCCR